MINAPVGSDLYVSAGNGHSGTYAAAFGAVGPTTTRLHSRHFLRSRGNNITIDFWLAHPYTDSENDFSVAWNGNTVMSLLDTGHFDYTEYSFSVVGTGSDTLQFSGREVPGWFYLDDVSMTQAAAHGQRPNPPPSCSSASVPSPSSPTLGDGVQGHRKVFVPIENKRAVHCGRLFRWSHPCPIARPALAAMETPCQVSANLATVTAITSKI